jgi:hypothetical protein
MRYHKKPRKICENDTTKMIYILGLQMVFRWACVQLHAMLELKGVPSQTLEKNQQTHGHMPDK